MKHHIVVRPQDLSNVVRPQDLSNDLKGLSLGCPLIFIAFADPLLHLIPAVPIDLDCLSLPNATIERAPQPAYCPQTRGFNLPQGCDKRTMLSQKSGLQVRQRMEGKTEPLTQLLSQRLKEEGAGFDEDEDDFAY